jgi:hypothetical protein
MGLIVQAYSVVLQQVTGGQGCFLTCPKGEYKFDV